MGEAFSLGLAELALIVVVVVVLQVEVAFALKMCSWVEVVFALKTIYFPVVALVVGLMIFLMAEGAEVGTVEGVDFFALNVRSIWWVMG